MKNYLIIGRTENGSTVYYSGRAGNSFVTNEISEAFTYPSLESARRRATYLNAMTEIHGIRFFVPTGELGQSSRETNVPAHKATVLP